MSCTVQLYMNTITRTVNKTKRNRMSCRSILVALSQYYNVKLKFIHLIFRVSIMYVYPLHVLEKETFCGNIEIKTNIRNIRTAVDYILSYKFISTQSKRLVYISLKSCSDSRGTYIVRIRVFYSLVNFYPTHHYMIRV